MYVLFLLSTCCYRSARQFVRKTNFKQLITTESFPLLTVGTSDILFYKRWFILLDWKENNMKLLTFDEVQIIAYQPRNFFYSPRPTTDVNVKSPGLMSTDIKS